MLKFSIATLAAASLANAFAGPGVYGDTPDAKHAWAVHDWNRPKPAKVTPAANPGGAPSDAIVLFDGSQISFERNWRDKDGGKSQWQLGPEGDFYSKPGWKNGGNIYTREKFADCQFHIEFRHNEDITDFGKGPQMRGNSGVFFMDKTGHEVQILESYYTSAEMEGKPGYVDNYTDGQAGSVYAENPPMVNPARKPGEWQVYDIIFHAPILEGDQVVHPGSLTVFFNGVLVQDHWEMEGRSTHCRRKPIIPHPAKESLMLQDHGCEVHFRNIWYRPLPSRWDNLTHSVMSAKTEEVMKLRRATAAKLFAQIANKEELTLSNAGLLAEVISYAKEGEFDATWKKVAQTLAVELGKKSDGELKAMQPEINKTFKALDTLVRNKVLTEKCTLWNRLRDIRAKFNWK